MTPQRATHSAVAFAAIVRAAHVIADLARSPLAAVPLHDAARYDAWAQALAAGTRFDAGAFSQAPLYPYVLGGVYAVAGRGGALVFALQAALGVATVLLAATVARRARGERAAAWAAWLVALYQPLAFFETKRLPAALVALLAVLAVERAQAADAANRSRGWGLAGAVLGLLCLASAGFLLALPATLVWIAWDRSRSGGTRAARAALCLGAAAAVIAPATLHNRAASGDWVPITTNAGITFWQGNNPNAEGVFSIPEGFTGSITTQREEARRIASEGAGRPLDDAAASSYWMGKGLSFLAANPGRTLVLVGRKALLALSSVEQPLEYSPRLDANPFRRLMPLPFGLLLALALAGALGPGAARAEAPSWIVGGVCAATLLAFFVACRYRLPAIAPLGALAGGGAAWLVDAARAGGRAIRVPAIAAALVLAVSLAWYPATQGPLRRAQDATSLDDLGNAQRDSGRAEEALTTYDRSIALDPGSPFPWIDRGKAAAALGRRDDAERSFREAIRIAPDLSEARFELGVLLFEAGRLDEAADSFARATALDPYGSDPANNYAGTLLRLGRVDEARTVIRGMRSRGLPVDPPLARAVGE